MMWKEVERRAKHANNTTQFIESFKPILLTQRSFKVLLSMTVQWFTNNLHF